MTLDIRHEFIAHERVHLELEIPLLIVVDPTDRGTRIVLRETLHRFAVRRPAAEVDSKFDETGFREVEAVLLEFIQRFRIDIARPALDYAVELSVGVQADGRQTAGHAGVFTVVLHFSHHVVFSSQCDSPQCVIVRVGIGHEQAIFPVLYQHCPVRLSIFFYSMSETKSPLLPFSPVRLDQLLFEPRDTGLSRLQLPPQKPVALQSFPRLLRQGLERRDLES
jgi:hypothetical protein